MNGQPYRSVNSSIDPQPLRRALQVARDLAGAEHRAARPDHGLQAPALPGERAGQRLVDQRQPLRDLAVGDQPPAEVGQRGQLQVDVTGLPARVDAAADQRARLVGVGDHVARASARTSPAGPGRRRRRLGAGEPAGRGGVVAEVDQWTTHTAIAAAAAAVSCPARRNPTNARSRYASAACGSPSHHSASPSPSSAARQVRRRQRRLERRPRLGPPALRQGGRPGVAAAPRGTRRLCARNMGQSTDVRPG